MKGWTMPVQRASYRGVRFEVMSVDDELYRATIEHAYPFVDGADVEDLGLNPLTVRMQAVFYGEGYYTDFKKFLRALQEPGAAVLVHPIRGRLQNMLCTAANFRHEAEMIDYVALDLTFVESTPAKPIFVFNNYFYAYLDRLLTQLEDFVDDVMALYGEFMEIVAFANNIKSRVQGMFGALFGCVEQLRELFTFDKQKYGMSPAMGQGNAYKKQSAQAVANLLAMIDKGLVDVSSRADLSAKAKFDEVVRQIKQIHEIPRNVLRGIVSTQNNAPKQAAAINEVRSLTTSLTTADMVAVDLMLHLGCAVTLVRVAAELMDDEALLPREIEGMARQVRSIIAEDLALLRTQMAQSQGNTAASITQPVNGFYAVAQRLEDKLRNQAQQINRLALAAINRKPPLRIAESPLSGTIQQVAHAFYGDYTRSGELLRLNPQIRQPNWILRGSMLNRYDR